jgi:hypothetical protein
MFLVILFVLAGCEPGLVKSMIAPKWRLGKPVLVYFLGPHANDAVISTFAEGQIISIVIFILREPNKSDSSRQVPILAMRTRHIIKECHCSAA